MEVVYREESLTGQKAYVTYPKDFLTKKSTDGIGPGGRIGDHMGRDV